MQTTASVTIHALRTWSRYVCLLFFNVYVLYIIDYNFFLNGILLYHFSWHHYQVLSNVISNLGYIYKTLHLYTDVTTARSQ